MTVTLPLDEELGIVMPADGWYLAEIKVVGSTSDVGV